MSYQTSAPLPSLRKAEETRSAYGISVGLEDVGGVNWNPPYQRSSVWTNDQRINLIRSALLGIPLPSVMLSDRTNWSGWTEDEDAFAVIDGKQRLETLRAWFSGELLVPASWFPSGDVETTEDREDGQWVSYLGLTVPARRNLKLTIKIPVCEVKTESLEQEAEMFVLINSAGTNQTAEDLDRARKVATGL